MSEYLFPHARAGHGTLRLRLALAGLAGFAALGLLAGVLALQTLGVISGDVRVTVRLATVGDTLGINSDVKYNGLRVGRVVEVDPVARKAETGWDGPTAIVLVAPEHAGLIPAAVRARVLPGTLFGNEYVDLVASPAGGHRRGHRRHDRPRAPGRRRRRTGRHLAGDAAADGHLLRDPATAGRRRPRAVGPRPLPGSPTPSTGAGHALRRWSATATPSSGGGPPSTPRYDGTWTCSPRTATWWPTSSRRWSPRCATRARWPAPWWRSGRRPPRCCRACPGCSTARTA
ncbi:MCE family protein [Nocardioides sp. W3-2-3]|nr:MCE family protein [Nocardioides convexus]